MTEPPVRRAVTAPRGTNGRQRDRTILVVDDHVTFAEACASVIDDVPGLHAFAATTTEQALQALAELQVDVVLLEVDLDGGDGMRFARQILSGDPGLRVIAVTASEDENRLIDAVQVGVSGWVPKNEPVEHLVSVVQGVLRGETRIPPQLLTRVLARLTSAPRDAAGRDQRLASLTRREQQILDLLVAGMKTNEIAQRLCLSRNTLRTHTQNILGKLNVHSTVAAVALVRRAAMGYPDLLSPAGPQNPALAIALQSGGVLASG
jgi:DNA-binding NarL/FixJ family response regulator